MRPGKDRQHFRPRRHRTTRVRCITCLHRPSAVPRRERPLLLIPPRNMPNQHIPALLIFFQQEWDMRRHRHPVQHTHQDRKRILPDKRMDLLLSFSSYRLGIYINLPPSPLVKPSPHDLNHPLRLHIRIDHRNAPRRIPREITKRLPRHRIITYHDRHPRIPALPDTLHQRDLPEERDLIFLRQPLPALLPKNIISCSGISAGVK